jgi:hypothetical protein
MTSAYADDDTNANFSPPNTECLTSTLPAERGKSEINTMRMLTMNFPTKEQLMSKMNNEPRTKSPSERTNPHSSDEGNTKRALTSYNTLSRFESRSTAALEEYQSFHHDWDSFFQCLVQYKEKYGVRSIQCFVHH